MLPKNAADALFGIHKVRPKGDSRPSGARLPVEHCGSQRSAASCPGLFGEKHQSKRVARLLDHPHLRGERLAVYRRLARMVIGACLRPLIVVDDAEIRGDPAADPKVASFARRTQRASVSDRRRPTVRAARLRSVCLRSRLGGSA